MLWPVLIISGDPTNFLMYVCLKEILEEVKKELQKVKEEIIKSEF